MIQIFTHICPVVSLSFFKLCDPSEMSFILVWSRSCALHQLNFYTGSQLCHSIHPQNKTPRLMISLSSIFQMRHGLFKKREREKKMACPRSMTQKKQRKNGHINVHEKKRKKWTHQCPWKKKKKERQEKKYIYIAMSSCYPNKGERFIKGVFHSTIHLPHICTILINLCDLSSPWIHCLILQYMWLKCMLPFSLPCTPHKLSLEVGWKEAMPWWGYIYTMSDMRDPMEK